MQELQNNEETITQTADWLTGGGEMGARIREFDWSQTPLGPRSSWSPNLRMMVRFLLANRFPMLLWWGPEFIQIYNDPYRPVLGAKHPVPGLGRSCSECWSEIWDILRPLIETPFNGGPSTWMEDISLELNRFGFAEETHFTIAYSPVPDESVPSGIGGVLATVHEISEKVVGERRMRLLRDLSARSGDAKTAAEACARLNESLEMHPKDIPFAMVYLLEDGEQRARLAGISGLNEGTHISPRIIEFGQGVGEEPLWPLAAALQTEQLQIVEDLPGRFGNAVPAGPWTDPPQQAVVAPINSNIAHQPAGFLVVGVSSRLRLDDSYRSFIELLTSQVSTAITNARAYEEERKRAEALAEIDRAKTAFFSNVSHEFRTPLTLMLGPLEEALANGLPTEFREQLTVAHRNSLRLLKLVNNLLDFSRIESGRVQAFYEATDLSALTLELASVFRSAIERAGIELVVDCPPVDQPVYVDREMWEKIVLNLLSNAFKFTFDGRIEVSLKPTVDTIELSVADSGTGIPPEELPHIFARFHRVRGARGRSYEGSGIGLALVQELVKLHNGTVQVESELDRGTRFTIKIPLGFSHLPAERIGRANEIAANGTSATAFVEEALRWLGDGDTRFEKLQIVDDSDPNSTRGPQQAEVSETRARILLADDNADMREYLRRLLGANYEVVAVHDGTAALEAARQESFDLVLADVMMPRLDGFGLLAALRADEALQTISVILLSARAGEEARVHGLAKGADDYLIKPFSARELLARIEALLKLQRIRRDAAARETDLLKREREAREAAEEANKLKDQFLATLSHELRNPLNVILGYLELLVRTPEIKQHQQLLSMSQALKRNAQAQSQLINDLLDLSRLQMGKLSLSEETVSLATIVNNAVETVTAEAKAKEIQIDVKVPTELLFVHGDSLRLQQVIWNLLNNAVKFTGNRGNITVDLTEVDDEAVLSVEDTGQGIPPDFLPHVFEMFRQADSTIVREHSGLGIGLALVHQIVKIHGGTVAVESKGLGQGARFTVHLPLRSLKKLPAVLSRQVQSESLSGMSILVIDDSEDTTIMLRDLLVAEGATVRSARSGAEGLGFTKQHHFDAILSDLSMPLMDGFEFLRKLRMSVEYENVPVLALTGFGRQEDIERAKDAGFFAHITKPVDINALSEILQKMRTRRATTS